MQNLNGETAITYFVKDERKSGGSYVTIKGEFHRIDDYEKAIVMRDGSRIFVDDILDIESIEKIYKER